MRLVRIGPLGAERPAALVTETSYVDVSDIVSDYDGAFFQSGGLDRLRGVVQQRAQSWHARTRSCA